jgi:hypothetical protein
MRYLITLVLTMILVTTLAGCGSQAEAVTGTISMTTTSSITATSPTVSFTTSPPSVTLTNTVITTQPAITVSETPTATQPVVTVSATPAAAQPAVTVSATPAAATTFDAALNGQWTSNEKNSGLTSGPFLKFSVTNGRITSLSVTVFPLPSEYFLWFIEKPLDIQNNAFKCSTGSMPAANSQTEFTLEGKFGSDGTCSGTMKFPKGFYWVDFAVPNDVIIPWTAHK